MENFTDVEFFSTLAYSLQVSRESSDESTETVDDFPEQEGSSGFLAEFAMLHEPLTLEEKEDLIEGVQNLPMQYHRGMWNIIGGYVQEEADGLNLEQAPPVKLRELDNYIKRMSNMVCQAGQPDQEQF